MIMNRPTIYLAGAIHHVPPDFALSWRREATKQLDRYYDILDPTADKDLYRPDVNTSVYTPEEIVTADLNMILKSHIILAEITRTDIPYHGTSMEICYGASQNKHIVVWGGCESYWVRFHSDVIVQSLSEAVDYLHKRWQLLTSIPKPTIILSE